MDVHHAFKALDTIALVSSRISKQNLLRANDRKGLREVLTAAYNPYRTYGITTALRGSSLALAGSAIPQGERIPGPDNLTSLLTRLASRELTGNAARDYLWSFLEGATWETQWVVHGILNKDFGVGISTKTINEVFPGLIPTFNCALAKTYNPTGAAFPAIVETKMDGKRIVALVRDGETILYSRNGLIESKYQHIRDQLNLIWAEDHINRMYDGELMIGMFGDRKASESSADFIIFDMMPLDAWERGCYAIPQTLRLKALSEFLGMTPTEAKNIKPTDWEIVNSPEQIQAKYAAVIAQGGEGVMVKDPHAPYPFKRSSCWGKVKPAETLDLEITGVFEGEGKFQGMLGGIIVKGTHNGREINSRVGSGFDDGWRLWGWGIDEGRKLVGKTAEVGFTEITPDGSLRFPRFVRIREDKS